MDPEDEAVTAIVATEGTDTSTVTLSPDLWQHILDQAGDEDLAERVAVALSPARSTPTSEPYLRSIVCWARKRKAASKRAGISVDISPTLLKLYPHLRPSEASQLHVEPTKLLELTDLVLLATTQAAYDASCANAEAVGTALKGHIVRQGEIIRGQGGSYRVVMAEPVLQGLITTETRFIVAPSIVAADARSLSSDEDEDDLDISEAFLATSLVDHLLSAVSTPTKSGHSNGHVNGHEESGDGIDAPPSLTSSSAVVASPLHQPIDSHLLHPLPLSGEDDCARVYLRPADLARLGIFSGAWVVAASGKPRLTRVYALPSSVTVSQGSQALVPPTLLFNLASTVERNTASLLLNVQPLRLSSSEWHLPTAAIVTISRICSPLSVDRQYQPLFLSALKLYFEHAQRIVCSGDVIAVPIDAALARLLPPSGKDVGEVEVDQLPSATLARATDVVYFQITAVDVDTSSLPASATVALEDRIVRGELGAIIDPQTTKMVQAGSSQSLVPAEAAAAYLGIFDEPLPPTLKSEDESLFGKLVAHVKASLRAEASSYDLPLSVLIRSTGRGSGKRTLARWTAAKAGLHLLEIDCYDLIGETDVKTEGHLRARFDKAITCAPCIFLLTHVEALARKTQTVESGQEPAMASILQDCMSGLRTAWKTSGHPVIVIGTTAVPDRIPASVLACFKTEFALEAPAEAERYDMLRSLTRHDHLAPDVVLRSIAVQTAALVANDLVDLVARTRSRALQRVQEAGGSDLTSSDVQHAGIALTADDFAAALDKARASYSESIGAPKIPNVTWDDVGGLANVKSEILDTIQLPLERPELFADGLKKRSGILLYGPPGTGKTLLAKAVATSCSLNFFSVKGPELLNMYIGESEANVRRVFQRARDAKPCVIFFDELDSVAPKRGNQGDSGGVMDRIVSQLLAELDGMADGRGGADVFVVGATNRPDLLDPALLRPGRFDRMLYLGVSDTHDAQLRILQALTRKFRLSPDCQLAAVAQLCPFNYTGADFYALCSDAMLKAMSRKAEAVEDKIRELNAKPPYSTGEATRLTPQYYLAELATPDDVDVLVGQQDFEAALRELVPSVSAAEMEHYRTVQQRFSGTTSKSNGVNGTTSDSEDEAPPAVDRKGKGKARA